jgi:hypothetical protein
VAGVVGATGTVVAGTGFTVNLLGAGTYAIDFPVGTFTTLPVVVVSPYNSGNDFRLVKVTSIQDFSGLKRVTVNVSSTVGTGTATNAGFSFVAVQG